MLIGIGTVGLTGVGCCLWVGLVHSLIDDSIRQQGGIEALERRAPPPADAFGEVRRELPAGRSPGPPVRRGLMPAAELEPEDKEPEPPAKPAVKRRSTSDEGEIFGF